MNWVGVLTRFQEGTGFIVDEDDEEEEVRHKERRKKKRKNRDRDRDEALDEEDLDLIGVDYEPKEATVRIHIAAGISSILG